MSLFFSAPIGYRSNAAVLFLLVLSSFFLPQIQAQSIDRVGSSETFDVATWNIEWFGATGLGQGPSDVDQQRENVERVIRESGIDLWGLQEISDTRQFDRLLDSLGTPWEGILASVSGQQRIGFIYDTDVVTVKRSKHILEQFSTGQTPPNGTNYFAGRAPLELKIDVTLPDTTVNINIITLHMKCCADSSSRDRRELASGRLKIHLDFTEVGTEPVIVLGDFNDFLIGSIGIGPSPYDNFSEDDHDYQFPTLPLDKNNVSTFCFSDLNCNTGSTIDHILINDNLFAPYVAGSADRMGSVLTALTNYVFTTSDHMPVYARFMFPTNTARASRSELPDALSILSVYPNPANSSIHVGIQTKSSDAAKVEVFDLLGRRQLVDESDALTTGEAQIEIDTSGLAAGIYVLRVSHGSQVKYGRFVKGSR